MRIKNFIYSWQLLIAFATVTVIYCFDHFLASDHGVTDVFQPVRKEAYGTLATIFGALFGFVITAFSIVVSLGESKLIARLKENGDYTRVTSAFIRTIYTIGASTALTVVAIFMDTCASNPSRGWEYVVLFACIAGTLAVLGIIFVLEMLIGE
ncbi:MAG: hypothetical protein WA324_07960 [Bryobacteraceae bacterium]